MAYTPNVYTSYDKSKTFEENKANGAVIEADKMNALEQQVSKNVDDIDSLSDQISKLSRSRTPIGYTIPQSPSDNYEQWTLDRIKESVDSIKDFGFTNIHIYNRETYDITSGWDWEYPIIDMIEAVNYVHLHGLSASIRLYTPSSLNDYRDTEWSAWHVSQVQSLIDSINDNGVSIRYFGDFNENPTILSNFTDTVKSVSNKVREITLFGVTFAGFNNVFKADTTIIDTLDWIGINLYPSVGVGYESGNKQLTAQQIADSIKSRNYDRLCKKIKEETGLIIILSEIGTTSYWVGYDNPEYTGYTDEEKIKFEKDVTGAVGARFNDGVLRALNCAGFTEIDFWYNLENDNMKDVMRKWVI